MLLHGILLLFVLTDPQLEAFSPGQLCPLVSKLLTFDL